MRIASGKVVDGRVELEGDETFEADAETERMLLEAIAQCERGQTTPMTQVLSELRSRE